MKVAVAVLTLAVSLHVGEALRCKSCPEIQPACRLEDTRDLPCTGSCMKVTEDGHTKTFRFCTPVKMKDGCMYSTSGDTPGYTCVCNTDLCNTGPSTSPPSVFGLIILLAAGGGLFT